MATWRLGGAETLVVGDAIEPLAVVDPKREADPKIAVEALRGVGLVRVVAADLIPPDQAVRAVLAGAWAASAEVELALRGAGDVLRVVWVVETVGRSGFLRRSVDAYDGSILSEAPNAGAEHPAAILLCRRRDRDPCDLLAWARCILGLPLSVELETARSGDAGCAMWRRVLGADRASAPSGKV